MAISSGINFFCSQLDVSGNLQIQYLFSGTGGLIIPSDPFAKTKYSGILQNTTNFYTKNGSGYFDGNNFIRVNNSSELNSDNFTILMTFESVAAQNGVLISSYSSGTIISGFALGLSHTNQPYLQYYDNNGPNISISQNNWGSKNFLILNKTTNSVSLSYFDINAKILETENFEVDDNYFLWSDNLTIGGATGFPTFFGGSGFRGYIDNFLLWKPGLLPNQQLEMISGIYCEPPLSITTITSGTTTVVTGHLSTYVPIFSGRTGQTTEFFNYLTGSCNNITAIYTIVDLTGIVYDLNITPQTQTIINYFTGVTTGVTNENSGYSRSFGMNAISFFKNNNSLDLTEIYYCTGINKTNFNKELLFDRISSQFLMPEQYISNQLNFYINSAAQFISGFEVTGNFYNLSVIMSGMAFVSGNYLSGTNYQDTESNILDVVSGNRVFNTGNYFIINGNTGISGLGQPNSQIFVAGFKLKSGLDYRVSGTNFILNDSYWYSVSGNLWTFPIDTELQYVSGVFNNSGITQFARNTSSVYMNSVRQNLSNDYLEISQFSPLNQPSNYIDSLPWIYDNNGLFIEFF